jgi:D-arabinose 1-dehydrogenase-like Zn-dependent alcohol dehydrogenase
MAKMMRALVLPDAVACMYHSLIIGCRGASKQDLVEVVRLTAAGKLAPVIGALYPLAETEAAAARLEGGYFIGRIVLTEV